MSEPISPPPVTDYKPEYIPAYLSNGLIGIRAGRIPLTQGLAIVNGLAAIHPADEVEGFSRAPYPVAGDISLDGMKLSEHPERVRFIDQRYDFSCGELRSRFSYEVEGIRADVEHLVFCSRTQPTLVLHELRVTANSECQLSIAIAVDQTDVPGRYRKRETDTPGADKPAVDGSLLWECHGGLSTCGAAYVTRFEGGEDVKKEREEHDKTAPLRTSYSVRARAGSTQVVRTMVSLIPSQSHSEPHREAIRLAAVGSQLGFDRLREENHAAWNDLWRGQVMWDIETFAFPPILLTDPRAADALLYYRTERLHAARRNAALNGYRGLQFPWASGPLHGEEMIRVSAPLIALEQHVGLSVALAFAQYAHASGDDDFLRERAWPVLEGVAQWLSSRIERTDRGYEIKQIIGIAEQREEPIDNAGYIKDRKSTRLN